MAELVATIITIAGLAIQSSKELYELIKTYQDAHKTRSSILAEIQAVQNLLTSLETALQDTRNAGLSEKLRCCLQDFGTMMEAFCALCEEFKAKIRQITQHSHDDKIDWRDKLRLHFEEKNILAFKYRLESYKLTINITLGLVTL
jgi:recombinational DNA repair ATPase RecF